MPRASLLACTLTCATLPALAQIGTPTLQGLVTQAGSATAFQVNGVEVLCSPQTIVRSPGDPTNSGSTGCIAPRLGMKVQVFGELHNHGATPPTLQADYLDLSEAPSTGAHGAHIGGYAIIDAMAAPGQAAAWTFRADGYRIRVLQQTALTFAPPLTGIAQVTTNAWVRYSGTQTADGTIVAEKAEFAPNAVKPSEDRLRTKNEFDPETPTEADRQGGLSKAFLGLDPKRLPATRDQAMQARVERIGNSLVPAYQKALPPSDPSRLQFRFQVVDQPKLHDALTLPNGIILVPQQVVERLENDNQLATVLADNIAAALEKQDLRIIPAVQQLTAANIAGQAGGFFVPGLALATDVAGGAAAEKIRRREEEQSGRVSLDLLHDAGYSIAEAPMTWWRLATLKNKPAFQIPMPYRAKYLYQTLATTWPPSTTPPPPSPALAKTN